MILQSLERKRRESLSKRFSLSVSSFRVLKVDPKVCLSVFRERTREREKERDENEESVFLLNASLCVCVSSFRVLKVDPKVCRERFVLLLRSEEAQKGFNQEMFQQFLQVNPTVAEQKYWTHIADSTKNRQDVLAGFLSSDRFVETTGESHGEYVNGLFSSLFQREATVIELNHWVALLTKRPDSRTPSPSP